MLSLMLPIPILRLMLLILALQDLGASECMSAIAGSYGYIAPGIKLPESVFHVFPKRVWAFVQETAWMINSIRLMSFPHCNNSVRQSVSSYIVEKITSLDSLRFALAKFWPRFDLKSEVIVVVELPILCQRELKR